MIPRTAAVLAVSGAALLALPGAASAGTLTVATACVAHLPGANTTVLTQPIVIAITGGTPNRNYQVRAGKLAADGGSGSVIGTFDAAGNALATLTNVFPPSGSIAPLKGDTLQLAVHDFATNADIATGTTRITNATIDVARTPRSPYRPRVLRVSGLTPLVGPGALYGSYVSGYNGTKVIKRIKLGTPNACGYLRVRRVLPPRRGTHKWTLFIHVGPTLDRSKAISFKFKVFKRFF